MTDKARMQTLLADLAEAQHKLRQRADRWPGLIEHANALAGLEALISAAPRVILLGERNAGKTSLANLLLDQAVVPDSVVGNTRWPLIMRCAETISGTDVARDGTLDLTIGGAPGGFAVGLPNPRLASFDLVDTPGLSTSAQLDGLKLRSTDLLVWCTLATQAWKESERRLWMSMPRRYHRDAILVATHRDHLRGNNDARKVRARLAAETMGCFRSIAFVCAVSRAERRSPKRRFDGGAAELDDRIEESLSAIALRRSAAGYRLAMRVVGKALALVADTPPLPASRGHRRTNPDRLANPSVVRLPLVKAYELAPAEVVKWHR
jgi:hypothetical protein